MANAKRSKNHFRRERAKIRKLDGSVAKDTNSTSKAKGANGEESNQRSDNENIDIDTSIQNDPLFESFKNIFNKFQDILETQEKDEINTQKDDVMYNSENNWDDASGDSGESDTDTDIQPLSKRQLRKRNKIPLALLKASSYKPQVVEWYDVDAQDPYLLVALKSQHNVVQVPNHWSSKREYLASRKGIERLPFQLPNFIQDTGIQDMRSVEDQTLKQQQRERVQPKMGKLDIDYKRLHDAFFKFQSKPRLFGYGDVYFEGREATDEYTEEVAGIKPGVVSSRLRSALGLPENDLTIAPPWITIMQEIGKPPAYESLIIPGLDIEYSNDGYKTRFSNETQDKEGIHEHWGRLEEYIESSEDEESEEEDEEDEEDKEDKADVVKIQYDNSEEPESRDDEPVKVKILEFGGYRSKTSKNIVSDNSSEPKQLYTVIKENRSSADNGLLKGEFGYNLSNKEDEASNKNRQSAISENIPKETKFKF